MFSIRKLYLDLVADDGSVCIAYVSALRALGVTLTPSGVELYGADRTRTVRRGSASLSLDAEPESSSLSRIEFALDGVRYAFETEPEQAAFAPPSPAAPGFRWNVKLARARGRLSRLDGGQALCGNTYADWVELSRPPRALGLLQLEWGRVHLEAGTVIYTHAALCGAPSFRAASLWARGCEPQPIAAWTLEPIDRGDGRRLRFGDRGEAFEVRLRPERALHAGAAADAARFPSRLEQGFYRALCGPMREQRWLSRASSSSFGDGFAIHESVRFGAAARSAA